MPASSKVSWHADKMSNKKFNSFSGKNAAASLCTKIITPFLFFPSILNAGTGFVNFICCLVFNSTKVFLNNPSIINEGS